MKFYSTKKRSSKVSLKGAVLSGLANDGGLFMPDDIPRMPQSFINNIPQMSFQEISFELLKALLSDKVPVTEQERIVQNAFNFKVPLILLDKDKYVLELFHGPTLAFKDFGARFMANLLSFFASKEKIEMTILVATSGDTGSAVGNGFLGVKGIKVYILYPSKKVSEIQEKQLTTLGKNITALEIKGTFDDCQYLVKEAFLDNDLNKKFKLCSANSINVGRLIPQIFYYFQAFARLKDRNRKVVISVPSGNLGNLTAGLIAKIMGLPIHKFVASSNINDTVQKYLKTSMFKPKDSIRTISNSMDVGNPSNLERILELYNNDWKKIKKDLIGYSFTDKETKEIIHEVYDQYNYILDPHGAVGYLGLKKFLNENNNYNGIFLETAHPAKFKDIVEEVIQQEVQMPERLRIFLKRKKVSIVLDKEFESLKQYFMGN